jgi:hypothetical protein
LDVTEEGDVGDVGEAEFFDGGVLLFNDKHFTATANAEARGVKIEGSALVPWGDEAAEFGGRCCSLGFCFSEGAEVVGFVW